MRDRSADAETIFNRSVSGKSDVEQAICRYLMRFDIPSWVEQVREHGTRLDGLDQPGGSEIARLREENASLRADLKRERDDRLRVMKERNGFIDLANALQGDFRKTSF